MDGVALNTRQQSPALPAFLKPVLTALLAPLGAVGAVIIALNGRGGKPVRLCESGDVPPALLRTTELLVTGSQFPSHGLSADSHPVLAGPWQMPSMNPLVLVFWRDVGGKPWKKQDYPLVLTVAAAIGAFLGNAIPRPKEAPRHGVTDIVTGLPRARKFVTDLPRHFARLDREGLPGTMILVSIDGFSGLNAQLGKQRMDNVLRRTAELLNRVSRPTDVVARIDDGEFAVWLNGADHLTAAERAEQLREDSPGTLVIASEGRPVTLSVGIAARRPGSPETVNILMQRADYAMHEAKKIGPGLWRVSQEEVG
jgi:diguanylate cyclase (GGDEF)-like protein